MTDADRIAKLEARVAELEKIIGALRGVFTGVDPNAASDRELDAQYGDPTVRVIPRDWTGGGVAKGMKFSTCPPDFLELLAEAHEYFARKAEAEGKLYKGKPVAGYEMKNARLARGWARRLRNGWTPPAPPARPAAPSFGGGAGNGAPRGAPFGGGAAPAAASPFGARPAPRPTEDDDTSFDFGANVAPADDDDDLPL